MRASIDELMFRLNSEHLLTVGGTSVGDDGEADLPRDFDSRTLVHDLAGCAVRR